jgi:hypothetical protein
VSNITGLSQNGTDGTFATDTYMGFSFTLLAPAGNLAAGYHEYALSDLPPNTAPTVAPSASPSPATSAGTVTLASGAVDADGDPMTYAWTQTAGPTVALSSATASSPSFTAPTLAIGAAPLSLTFSVVATDTAPAASAAGVVSVTINPPPNTPPLAVAAGSPNPAEAGAVVTLDGSGSSDADGQAITYLWSQTGGPAVTLSSASATQPTFTAPAWRIDGQNAYTFQLVVNDGFANSIASSITINVQDTQAPVISGTPANIAQATDAGAATAIVFWTPPTAADNSAVASLTSSHASGSAFPIGSTTVTYTATDTAGNQTAASFTVTVNDPEAPVISGMPANIVVNTDAGLATAVVSWAAPTASDNVGVVSLSSDVASGSTFSIGVTTVSYTAMDAAGNQTIASFTVTVADAQPPVFTSLQANITLEVNFPATTGVVTWAAPAATDNSGAAVVITRTAGLASGASFPLGSTTVTYRATDGSGNFVEQSFVVTITQTAPATVTYVVNAVDDLSFTFNGADPALALVVATLGGTGQTTSAQLAFGQYPVSATLPSGYTYTQASCNDTNSTFDVATSTGMLNLAAGEHVTCTFNAVNARGNATAAIGAMLETRGQLIVQNGPAVSRRIGRLTGARAGAGVISAYGASFSSAALPVSLSVGGDTTTFSYSSRLRGHSQNSLSVNPVAVIGAVSGNEEISQLAGEAAPFILADSSGIVAPEAPFNPMAQRWEIWAEGTITSFRDAAYDGSFGIVHVGADYLVNPKLLLGLGAQVDWIDMTGLDGSLTSGTGFMVGPYLTARLSDHLFFDARMAWGKSDNKVSPQGVAYTDQVAGRRWLATAALIGDFDKGEFNIRPEARLSYFSETTAAYVDAIGVSIPAVTVSFGSLELGPNLSRSFILRNAAQLTLNAGLEGVWTFALENTGTAPVANPVTDGFRGRVNAGMRYTLASGFDISASVAYDGIGDTAINAWTIALGLKYRF